MLQRKPLLRKKPMGRGNPKPAAKRERSALVLVPAAQSVKATMKAKPRPAPKAAVLFPAPAKDQRIRDSANGEDCTVRLIGACNFDPATTIWSHAPFGAAGKGMGLKSLDLLGCYCCSACHDVVDGRAKLPEDTTRDQAQLAWFFGMARSIVRLREKGLV